MAANGSARGNSLFKDDELSGISGVLKGEDFVEVTCGSTSRKHGDAIGRLKIFESGVLEVKCECIQGCEEGTMTPSEFEKHARHEEVQRRWKTNIWVMLKGRKVALLNTSLLKYYNRAEKASGSYKGRRARPFHRDELIPCVICKKKRRFRLHNKEEMRLIIAIANKNWKCSDFPIGNLSCDDDEERGSRKVLRGCPRAPLCKGCTSCVCFGCHLCRFEDCNCRTCVDFLTNL
ncbi:LOW QUALITY PROTEIN: protein ULTRAPETALA 1-like [Asparagus officinalis]|uniref:LOW QUALITY PROTEIN: protein ULTRAPETALA 1-like n=1 Tax=Asparagus officinalis TaxID=4686 RepID=UPI00098E6546|nr:LOW QUALITY PROTEIN: protein ULTRAPETALA 1-like [Asparagus officinalis]